MTHGYFLLLSIDETDTILICELSNHFYDWLETAALGGSSAKMCWPWSPR